MSKPYLDYNIVPGGNRTGYPCAKDAWAIVVKDIPVTSENISGERVLEIGHDDTLETKLKNYSIELGYPIGKPSNPLIPDCSCGC